MTTPAGREQPIVWNGRRVRAFVPTLLPHRDLSLATSAVARCAAAGADVERAAEELTGDFDALARLLLRAEGVASSFIEGVSAPVVEVVLAEQHLGPESTSAAWVASNLASVTQAIDGTSPSFSIETMCAWHRTLMADSPTPARYVGVIRTEQGWIGGNDPTTAHIVAPPPEELARLLGDLERFVLRDDLDPIAQAAIAHAQFELIQPFGDGNGRVGRVLVAWVLTTRLSLVTAPPVSVAIAMDVGGYMAGLAWYRRGDLDRWVQWFADAVRRSGARSARSSPRSASSRSVGATSCAAGTEHFEATPSPGPCSTSCRAISCSRPT